MDTLNPGESLLIGQQLKSANGSYFLMMQGDGNLVLYQGITSATSAVWSTGTFSLPSFFRPVRADMQQDGNFVLYNAANNPAWASGTNGHPGSRLVLQDDRNLVIYSDGEALWASNTIAVEAPAPAQEIRASKKEEVGWGKRMETEATLYRDGRLVVSCFTKNDNWVGGLRGHVLVVPVDSAGRSLWVSKDFACTTRCSIPDFSCASYGKDSFYEHFPAEVARYATRLDIYQADTPSFKDLRQGIIDFIKGLGEIAQEVKDQIKRVFG